MNDKQKIKQLMDTKAPENIELAYTLKPDLFNEVINDEWGWFFNSCELTRKNPVELYKHLIYMSFNGNERYESATMNYVEMLSVLDINVEAEKQYKIGLGYLLTGNLIACCYACKDNKFIYFSREPLNTSEAHKLGVFKYIETKWASFIESNKFSNRLTKARHIQ